MPETSEPEEQTSTIVPNISAVVVVREAHIKRLHAAFKAFGEGTEPTIIVSCSDGIEYRFGITKLWAAENTRGKRILSIGFQVESEDPLRSAELFIGHTGDNVEFSAHGAPHPALEQLRKDVLAVLDAMTPAFSWIEKNLALAIIAWAVAASLVVARHTAVNGEAALGAAFVALLALGVIADRFKLRSRFLPVVTVMVGDGDAQHRDAIIYRTLGGSVWVATIVEAIRISFLT